MTIEIEKGIPIPEPGRRKKGESLYPFANMNIGDSCVIEKNGHKSWAFMFVSIQNAQKKHGIGLTSRVIGDNARRVWRVK